MPVRSAIARRQASFVRSKICEIRKIFVKEKSKIEKRNMNIPTIGLF
jgi:hypothetical protein